MMQVRLAGAAALCALAVVCSLSSFASADSVRRRSLTSCTQFEQRDKDELSLELTVRSTCSMPIDCALSWQLVCAPDSRKRRKVTSGAASFTVGSASAQSADASAASCGDDSWTIKNITWRCEPSKE